MVVHKVEEQEGQAEEKNKGKEDLKVSLLTQVLPCNPDDVTITDKHVLEISTSKRNNTTIF